MLEGAWTEAGELEVLETDAVDMLVLQGRRAACAEAERGPSGEARDEGEGEVVYEIELRFPGVWRGRALEYPLLVEAVRRPRMGDRMRLATSDEGEGEGEAA